MPKTKPPSSNTTELTTTTLFGEEVGSIQGKGIGSSLTLAARDLPHRIPLPHLIPPDFELTSDMLAYAVKWTHWPEIVVMREFEKFKAHYEAFGKEAKNWCAMWRAWVMRGLDRREQQYQVGTVPHTIREKRQVEQTLGAMANGIDSSHECVRRAINGVFSEPHRIESSGLCAGGSNVVRGAFGGGSSEGND